MAKKKAKAVKPVTTKKAKAVKPEPMVAYRPFYHKGVKYEIGERMPKGWDKNHPQFRSFAPANIAGNMRDRRQYFLKLDGKK